MATKPDIKVTISGDASSLENAARESAAALQSVEDAAQGANVAVDRLGAAGIELRAARVELSRLQREFAELRAAAAAAGKTVPDAVKFDFRRQITEARAEIARQREAFQREALAAASAPAAVQQRRDTLDADAAKRLRYELQQVQFQITDIVTSLASGQNALTVLIQQGGQLKDMFGGIGGAVSALGRGIAAIISPFTLLVAALGGAAAGFVLGTKESNQLALALRLSGNAAGITEGQLQALAVQIGQVKGTTGEAADVLKTLAGSAVVGAQQLGLATEAAVRLKNVGGPAVQETAQLFVQLGENPTEAALRLNRTFNFLNETTFKQIKNLEEIGNKSAAAALAQTEFANTVIERSKEQENRLGFLQRAYLGAIDAGKSFFDSLKNIGRDTTTEERIAAVTGQINRLQNELAKGTGYDSPLFRLLGVSSKQQLEKLRLELQLLGLQLQEERDRAADAAGEAEENARRIRIANLGPQTADVQAQFAANTAAVRAALDLQRATLDDEFESNLISLEAYYARRKEILNQETEAEARVLEQQAKELRARLERGVPLEQQDAVRAQLTSTEGQLTALRIKNSTELIRLEADRRKASLAANQAFQDAVSQAERARSLEASVASMQEQSVSEAYNRGLISLQTYYKQRRLILQGEFYYEEDLLQKRLALAQEAERRAAPDALPAARREVLDIENQLAIAQNRRIQRSQRLNFDEQNDAREEIELGQRRILQLAELAGAETSAQANEQRRNVLLQQYRVELERARQTDVVRALTLERIIALQTAEQQLVAEKTKLARDTQQFAEREQEIQFQRQQGLITEQQAQNQLFAVAQQKARVELDAYEKLKEQLGNNLTAESRRQLDAFITAAKQGLQSLTPAAIAMNNALQQGFETAINGLLNGTFKLKDAFKSLAQSVAQQFTQIISRRIAGGIFSAIAGGGFGAGLGKVFGFAEGGMVRGPGSGTSDSIPARLSNGEFVQPARTVAHYGADFMEALRRLQVPKLGLGAGGGKRFAAGGLVGQSNSAATAARSQDMPVQVNIQNSGQAKSATAESSFDGKGLVISVLLEDIRTNGPIYQNMSNANRLRR